MSNATQQTRGCRWWAGRVLLGLLVVALVLVGAVLLLGARAKAQLRAEYPPPGQMVDVGGHRLHIQCQGEGSPRVVMEAGRGDPGLIWALVQPEIAETTRTCVYDRAGYGWSDPRSAPPTADAMVNDLHMLLEQAGEPGPYILVGHSLGGLLVRLYAHHYPDDVAGLVLVDASHEEQTQRFDPRFVATLNSYDAQLQRQLGVARIMVGAGLAALNPAVWPVAQKLPEEVAQSYRAVAVMDVSVSDALVAEMRITDAIQAEVRAAQITDLGDVPLVVLSRGRRDPLPPRLEVSQTALDQADRVWNEMQAELARQSSDSRRIMAMQSGHYVQLDQPELVVEVVEDVVVRVRQ